MSALENRLRNDVDPPKRRPTQAVTVLACLALVLAFMAPATAHAATKGTPTAKTDVEKDPYTRLAEAQAWVERANAVREYVEAQQAADIANYVQATQATLAAYLQAMTPLIAVDWGRWEALHNCEQPGNWYANGGNAADQLHMTFQGGLGMSTNAWQMALRAAAARGVTLPGSALAATPEEQMTGAQAFFDAYGWWWACRV
jgi:hypothetical protein